MFAHSTGLVFDERFLNHDTGAEASVEMRDGSFLVDPESHPSSVQITRRIKQFLDGSGLSEMMQPIRRARLLGRSCRPIIPATTLTGCALMWLVDRRAVFGERLS